MSKAKKNILQEWQKSAAKKSLEAAKLGIKKYGKKEFNKKVQSSHNQNFSGMNE